MRPVEEHDMQYWVLYGKHAIGPFESRDAAYEWAGVKQGLDSRTYAVKSDLAMAEYPHKERLAP